MKNNKKISVIIALIYFLLCLVISFHRIPFWDEARAWLISQNCNVFEFIDLMKLECHMFIWYLLIFPFAKLNLFYPYSIYTLNALIATFSIYILWKKGPFSFLEKFLITFSIPFLFLWGCVARCYSIGILFIFLALINYKIRFKKPFRYLTFLCLTMNTSVMAFVGAFVLGLIFLIENFKKKNFYKLLLLFLFSFLIVLIQDFSFNPDSLKQMPEMHFLRDFICYIINPIIIIPQYKIQSFLMTITRIAVDFSIIFFAGFMIKNNKKVLSFLLLTYSLLLFIFTVLYSGNFWHYFYFYLYFIVAIWILRMESKEKLPKHLNILFAIVLTCFLFKGSIFIDSKLTTVNDSLSKYIAQEILTNEKFKNAKLFCLDPWSDIAPSSLPYLKDKVKIYDINNNDRFSYQSMRSHIQFNTEFFNPDDFYKYVDDNSILLTTTAFTRHEIKNPKRKFDEKTKIIEFVGDKYSVLFIPLESKEQIHLWTFKIKVRKNNF